jgi:hypothetical protein
MADMELVLVSIVTISTQNCYIHSYFFNQTHVKDVLLYRSLRRKTQALPQWIGSNLLFLLSLDL